MHPNTTPLPALILAAGNSTRMGQPKALLPVAEGRPFVATIVRTLAAAGLRDIFVITGRDHDAIAHALAADAPPVVPRLVRNPDPSRGQLSSLWSGMDAVDLDSAEALLMTLVDVPLAVAGTVIAVIDAWRATRAPIVRPARGARHGHPVIFDRVLFEELRSAPLAAGAKAVVRAHAHEILDVQVTDERCLMDVDTPSDYALLERLESTNDDGA